MHWCLQLWISYTCITNCGISLRIPRTWFPISTLIPSLQRLYFWVASLSGYRARLLDIAQLPTVPVFTGASHASLIPVTAFSYMLAFWIIHFNSCVSFPANSPYSIDRIGQVSGSPECSFITYENYLTFPSLIFLIIWLLNQLITNTLWGVSPSEGNACHWQFFMAVVWVHFHNGAPICHVSLCNLWWPLRLLPFQVIVESQPGFTCWWSLDLRCLYGSTICSQNALSVLGRLKFSQFHYLWFALVFSHKLQEWQIYSLHLIEGKSHSAEQTSHKIRIYDWVGRCLSVRLQISISFYFLSNPCRLVCFRIFLPFCFAYISFSEINQILASLLNWTNLLPSPCGSVAC